MGGVVVFGDAEMETIGVTIAGLRARHGVVIVDTAGFRNQTTIAACVAADVVVIPLKPAAEDMRESVAMLNLVEELNGTPERRGPPIKAELVSTMVTPGTVIARQVRKELEKAGYPLLDAEVAQRVAFPELSMPGVPPSLVEPDGAAARDIGRVVGELNNLWISADVQAA
jgi:chromosome partitioning protein